MLDSGSECQVDESSMNTRFIYELDEIGVETAKSGLMNLLISIPYVIAFVQEIGSIVVKADNNYQRTIKRGVKADVESANVTPVHVSTTRKGETKAEDRFVFVSSNDSVSIAVEIRRRTLQQENIAIAQTVKSDKLNIMYEHVKGWEQASFEDKQSVVDVFVEVIHLSKGEIDISWTI